MGHNDLFGGTCYRHEAGGALPVDRHARDGDGQTCAQCSCAADRMLYALWQRRTEDDVVDLRRIDARTFDRRADRMCGKGWRGRSVERAAIGRSEEHTSELQSLMRISYAVFCLKKKQQ